MTTKPTTTATARRTARILGILDDHRATGPVTENALPIWELNILSQQRAKGDARQRFHSGLARLFASPSYSNERSLAADFARHSK